MQTGKGRLSEERRGSVRHPHTSSISFTTLGNSHNLPKHLEKPAETVDISGSGMKIRTSASSLRAGSIIKIKVPVAGSESVIPVLAEVIWVKEKKPETCLAGFKFIV
jgi:hypothetical protein